MLKPSLTAVPGGFNSLSQPQKRILCVEDNEDIAFLLFTVLKREGFHAVIANTATAALMLAGREEFDLYVLDLTFGGESGLDLCLKLREAHPDTPVIFYSAAAFDSDREAALRAGACAYVTKPGTDELLKAVSDVLGTN